MRMRNAHSGERTQAPNPRQQETADIPGSSSLVPDPMFSLDDNNLSPGGSDDHVPLYLRSVARLQSLNGNSSGPGGVKDECSNCGVTFTPFWKRGLDYQPKCIWCGLYWRLASRSLLAYRPWITFFFSINVLVRYAYTMPTAANKPKHLILDDRRLPTF